MRRIRTEEVTDYQDRGSHEGLFVRRVLRDEVLDKGPLGYIMVVTLDFVMKVLSPNSPCTTTKTFPSEKSPNSSPVLYHTDSTHFTRPSSVFLSFRRLKFIICKIIFIKVFKRNLVIYLSFQSKFLLNEFFFHHVLVNCYTVDLGL